MMNAWETMGKTVDGWVKFLVTLAAVGWFGLHVTERYTPRSATVTIGQAMPAVALVEPAGVLTASYAGVAEAEQVAREPAVWQGLVHEVTVAVRVLAANLLAQMAAVLAVGMTGGLVLQPRVKQWSESRAVRKARARANRHAADLRLLAAHDARGNVQGPSGITPLKRN